MQAAISKSDEALLGLLRKAPCSIAQLTEQMGVTGTAVRQRLTRLTSQGKVERVVVRTARGRPSHRYSVTEKGRREGATNFADLAVALWKELRQIKDPAVRSGLLRRVASAMGAVYQERVRGADVAERMQSISDLFAERAVQFQVDRKGQLPVLTAVTCPYPDLVEQDRGICAVEKMLFSELLGERVRLTDYRLEGAPCCRFETDRTVAAADTGTVAGEAVG